MAKSFIVVVALLIAAAWLAPRGAGAIEVGSPACKRELTAMHGKMRQSVAVLDSVKSAPAAAKCRAYSAASAMAREIRESAARCEPAPARTQAVRDADDVIDAVDQAYNKWCPPRPGMIRVHMTMIERVRRDKLPKPLQAAHTCVEEDDTIYSTNERFDLGRLVVLGCPGIDNPTAEQIAARNTTADLLKKEQAQLYLTRDKEGDDPRRLSFTILAADGHETKTDLLLAERVAIGDKRDLISSFWEPAKQGACRVHAVWRVADGEATLVLWEEASDCSTNKPVFKAVLDKR